MPPRLSEVQDEAFLCAGIQYIKIPPITTIGRSSFERCMNLKNVILPEGIRAIGNRCFFNSGLTSINLPDSLTNIDGNAFSGCERLTGNLIIPDSIITIRNSSFKNCKLINSIIIPCSVTSIEDESFANCTTTRYAIVKAILPPYCGKSIFWGSNFPIYVPDESLNAYKTATNWSNYASRIKPVSEFVE